MPKVGAAEFEARCLELMDRVAERRESYVITKRATRDFVDGLVQTPGLTVLEITAEVAVLAAQFPADFPGDPADRLIAATARAHRIPLVTSDERIQTSPLVQTIW
jgi:PIN domain nuclease of toxin-antitoxin system